MATIVSGGREYPCYPTMGAMLRYERMTGKGFGESDGSVTDALTRLYCLTCSACECDKVDKPADLQSFCDGMQPEAFAAWAASQASEESGEGDGKKA